MPRNEPKRDASNIRLLREVFAIVWLGAAVLTLLSLVSYDKNDMPFFNTEPNVIWANFIGPVGAFWSFALIFLFGLAAYLFPLLFFAAGLVMFLDWRVNWWWKTSWAAVFLVASACILHLQQAIGWSWISEVNTVSPGGFVGQQLDGWVLAYLLGEVGAAVVLSVVYAVSTIILFDLQPRTAWENLIAWWEGWQERRARARAEKDPRAALDFEQLQIARQMRELQRKLEKDGKSLSPEILEAMHDLPPLGDSSARPSRRQRPAPASAKAEPAADAPEPAPAVAKPEIIDAARTERSHPKASSSPRALEEKPAEQEKEKEDEAKAEEAPEPAAEPRRSRTPSPRPAEARPRPAAAVAPSAHRLDPAKYKLPNLDLLQPSAHEDSGAVREDELHRNSETLVVALREFGISVRPGPITRGPTITRYEVYPDQGVRVDKIKNLQRDIARVMRAEKINILAPIPGKDSVGIEIANSRKAPVKLRDLFESSAWAQTDARVPFAVGKDVYGRTLVADIAAMPHLLVAGTTGSGKSVCINCLLLSLLYKFSPDELRLILVDPKQVELQVYNTVPHLVVPVVTDPKKVLPALRWVIREMEDRYRILAKTGVRNIHAFNKRDRAKNKPQQLDLGSALGLDTPPPGALTSEDADTEPAEAEAPIRVPREDDVVIPDKLPYIVVVLDELADLMETAPADVESSIARLAAKARAAGIHLIVATQTPRKEVITGVIKANIPSRIAFQVASSLDSRVILDRTGAENLVGKGDCLYLPPGSAEPIRAQGAFVSDDEVATAVEYISAQGAPMFDSDVRAKIEGAGGASILSDLSPGDTELLIQAFGVLSDDRKISTSHLQRRLRIGYNRAAWAIDIFERLGILGPADPDAQSKPREVLVDLDSYSLPL